MANRYKTLIAGKDNMVEATVVSTGAGEAGDIIALDGSGKIDVSILPTGVGPDTKSMVTSESIGAGDYVNIFDVASVPTARLADNSNGREAHGFVLTATTSPASTTIYFEGANTALTRLTAGTRMYLDTAGGATTRPLDPATNVGSLHQLLGTACDATSIQTDIDDCVLL